MKRTTLVLMLLLPALIAGNTSIDTKISQTSNQISTFDKQYNTINSRLGKTARGILVQKRKILRQQKHLQELQLELNIREESYNNNQSELAGLQKQQSTLNKEQDAIEQKLVFALARNVSLSMLVGEHGSMNADAVITEEVLKQMTKQARDEVKNLNTAFKDYTQRIAALELRMLTLQASIKSMQGKYDELAAAEKANRKALRKLKKDKKRYLASIESIQNKQSALQKTLEELNIVKAEEAQKAARARQQPTARPTLANNNVPKVKQRGSSYQKIKTKNYRGRKTIAPIDDYRLIKKFGPYLDPIYNIKIFNESVSLKPKTSNAKVKNVLNGKVILAQNTSLLNNVVIVEHADGMHTIYAHLDQIAPTVRKGQKIKKGSIIGRVNNELMFEVTQKKYHIDPMQLIY
jgi:murein DD-endopeptidase MepM/ murein hydrolase activator NlpD